MEAHKEKTILYVRCTKTQEASDRAAVEDCPGGPWRGGAGKTKQGRSWVDIPILPKPRWGPGQPRQDQDSWDPTGCKQAWGKLNSFVCN